MPRAGGPTTVWGPTHNWVAPNRNAAFGLDADGNGGSATISSCFYLLVKHYGVSTDLFVCHATSFPRKRESTNDGTSVASRFVRVH